MHKGVKYGAIAGVLCWLVGGIISGVYFGGYGAVSILAKLSGGPVDSGILSRAFVLVGMCIGVFCTWTVSVVMGSLLGAVLGTLLTGNHELAFGDSK